MEKSRSRLRYDERVVIQALLAQGKSTSYIAKELGRHRSSIFREVQKWVVLPKDKYRAELAQFMAKEDYLNKRNLDKINTYQRLKDFVYSQLALNLSSEQISGRLSVLFPNDPVMSISHEAIYKHIYRKRQSKLGKYLISLLPYSHSKRRINRKTGKRKSRIKDARSIELRPEDVELRREVGHWESDLVIGLGRRAPLQQLWNARHDSCT
ncbi:IS30 family transposase [Flavobacterium sp. 3HN19-14]|uniref:IS30 family transposase n=1 Tax=Flavobacterium sp. 3HN19-14 TaxID=3448133 RepID=UPI003EDF154B